MAIRVTGGSFVRLAPFASCSASMARGLFPAAPAQAQVQTPCAPAWAGDVACDAPKGRILCDGGTDPVDCSNPASNFGWGAGFAAGASASGGGGAGGGGPANPCPDTDDGGCDDPNGRGLCAFVTDANDWSNPGSTFGSGVAFAGGVDSVPTARTLTPPPSTPTLGGGTAGIFTGTGTGAGGPRGCPNRATTSAAFGSGTLASGGATGPVQGPGRTAGGRHAPSPCFPGTGWRGFTLATGRFTLQLISNATATVVAINAPDGQWVFSDESNGMFNATIPFNGALSGRCDIRAGSCNRSSHTPAQRWISDQ